MMNTQWILFGTQFAVVGAAMVAGFFLTFSDFLMRAFHRAQPEAGIEVMQTLNREIFRSLTVALLWGMLLLSLGLVAASIVAETAGAQPLLILAATLYTLGVLVVSYRFNIPMNNKLEALDCRAPEASKYWDAYVPRWTAWNYVRAASSWGAAVCYVIACVRLA